MNARLENGEGREGATGDVGPDVRSRGDTIVAISTGVSPGAIGIVRMSGPEAVGLARTVFRSARGTAPDADESHTLVYGHVVEPAAGSLVDEVLLAVMRAPRTYTREDVVEFHCHGGIAAQRAILRVLTGLGARLAEPGEFTKRAFLNGRIDLAQAESVATIVAAKSTGALRAAVRQLEGGLSTELRAARRELVGALAEIEATVDFADEGVDDVDWDTVRSALTAVELSLSSLLQTALVGRAFEQGLRTAIVGKPNVGKSSLLNALLMRERAIVSDTPGTTRDTVEELMEIGGIPIHLVDTAGLRRGGDAVEQLGVARSVKAMEQADLVLLVVDLSREADEEDRELLRALDPSRSIAVGNKLDLLAGRRGDVQRPEQVTASPDQAGTDQGPGNGDGGAATHATQQANAETWVSGSWGSGSWASGVPGFRFCSVSAVTGEGLDELRLLIQNVVTGGEGLHLEEPILASERHRALVCAALESLRSARDGVDAMAGEELVCEDIRESVRALGRITGDELTPDLLDEIFSRFCLGK